MLTKGRGQDGSDTAMVKGQQKKEIFVTLQRGCDSSLGNDALTVTVQLLISSLCSPDLLLSSGVGKVKVTAIRGAAVTKSLTSLVILSIPTVQVHYSLSAVSKFELVGKL